MPRQKPMQFTPTPSLRKLIEAKAKESGLHVSSFLRMALTEMFGNELDDREFEAPPAADRPKKKGDLLAPPEKTLDQITEEIAFRATEMNEDQREVVLAMMRTILEQRNKEKD